MSGLLERIARRRRALSEHRLQPPSELEGRTLSVDPHGSAGPTPSLNGASPNGADPIGHFVDAVEERAPQPAPDRSSDGQPASAGEGARDSGAWAGEGARAGEGAPAGSSREPSDQSEAPTTEIGAVTAEASGRLPAQPSTSPTPAPEPADLGERASLRRRARYLRKLREIQLRDIGGLLVELHRFGRERPDLVQAKVDSAAETAAELRGIESVLADGRSLRELREAGIGGACEVCGAVYGSRDRFCSACGVALAGSTPATPGSAKPALADDSVEATEQSDLAARGAASSDGAPAHADGLVQDAPGLVQDAPGLDVASPEADVADERLVHEQPERSTDRPVAEPPS